MAQVEGKLETKIFQNTMGRHLIWIVAAIFLSILIIIQTVCSVIQSVKENCNLCLFHHSIAVIM